MFFLFSGEGPTDLGVEQAKARVCNAHQFRIGPLAVMVDQLVQRQCKYSVLHGTHFGYVPKSVVKELESGLRKPPKSMRLSGKKRARETLYFFSGARVLAVIAKEVVEETGKEVVVIFFRDADKSSAGRGGFLDKRKSMEAGFELESFAKGVPMIPVPTSEAWLICALSKSNPAKSPPSKYAGVKKSKALKMELEELLGEHPSGERLRELVSNQTIDVEKIDMECFIQFRRRLEEVV
ncbi:hypothetical protein [Candidatus Laterigemmans baculatus]|uniref:hypothetical protein n=1 Tax=Candidatus Laterigemmans baculatus TaxID=2770505 RepID=UPI0013DA3272|nr:hypothetical protein [Candidatus Laterigemmans baculatus]